VRDAVIGYERTEVTPDKAAEIMRQNGATPAELDLFKKTALDGAAKGWTPEQQSVEAFKAVDIARHPLQNHKGEFLGSEDNVAAMFRSRIYQDEGRGLTAEQMQGLGRNASLVDFLTGPGEPAGLGVPGYNLVRRMVYRNAGQPVSDNSSSDKPATSNPAAIPAAAAPEKTTQVAPPPASETGNGVLSAVGGAVGALLGVTPAYAEEMPATKPADTVPAAVKPAATADAAASAADYRTQLTGEIIKASLEIGAKPGVKKVLAEAQTDQDMALAVQNITGIDVHADAGALANELNGMTTAQLEAKRDGMREMTGMLGMVDPLLEKMSPQAASSLAGLVNGGSKLMNMGADLDGSKMLAGLGSMFGADGSFDLNGLMSGMGGLGDMLKNLFSLFSNFMGEMFKGFTGSNQMIGASNSGGQLTADMNEQAQSQPGVNGRSPTYQQFFDANGKAAIDDAQFTLTARQREQGVTANNTRPDPVLAKPG
jgi:hypothetical protein